MVTCEAPASAAEIAPPIQSCVCYTNEGDSLLNGAGNRDAWEHGWPLLKQTRGVV